jgi:hypothetical protein
MILQPRSETQRPAGCGLPPDAPITLGEELKADGMKRAARMRKGRIIEAQLRFLDALLTSPDRTATTDDCAEDLNAVHLDGGKWLGCVTKQLAHRGIIQRAGYRPSSRSSRHATPIGVWRAAKPDAVLETLHLELLRDLAELATEEGEQ